MKVLDLRCANGHGFEGWFASEDAFMAQNGSAQIACPLCADTVIARMPSAPRLNLSGARAPVEAPKKDPAAPPAKGESTATPAAASAWPSAPAAPSAGSGGPANALPQTRPHAGPQTAPQHADLQAAWLGAVRHLMARTEDVGPRFAEEARRIHYGETPQRGIRGQATAAEREALQDEGIETVAIPVPRGMDGPVQ